MSKRLTLSDLRNDECRFIFGEPRGIHTLYCGERAKLRKAYCERHSGIVYRAGTALSEAEIESYCSLEWPGHGGG